MKLYGSLRELVSAVFKKDNKNITLRPNDVTPSVDVEFELPNTSTNDELVSLAAGQILTNKTLTSPSISSPALSGTTTGTFTLTGATIDGDSNTVQDLALGSLKTDAGAANQVILRDGSGVVTDALLVNANIDAAAAISRTKVASGIADHVVINNGSGVLSSEAQLAVTRGGTGTSTSTGSGSVVLSNSPTLVTPALGTPSAVVLTNGTSLPIVGGTTGTLTVARGGTGATDATNAFDNLAPTTAKGDLIVYDGTDNIRLPVGANNQALVADSATASGLKWASVGGDVTNGGNSFGGTMKIGTTDPNPLELVTGALGPNTRIAISAAGAITFPGATMTSADLRGVLTDETGSGSAVFATSPTLVTPNLGTPSAVTLTNGTGLPISTGVSGLAAGIATFLGTPSSANLASAVTDETGTGALVFANSPTLVTPALGTPSSATLTNATGLPISTGVAGLGSGVATFLATPSSANLASAVTDETGTGALVFNTDPAFSTRARFPTGSASTPSITWLGSLTTGIYSSAANETSFANNGVQTSILSSTGAWTDGPGAGLGTAAGAYHLDYGTRVSRFNSASGSGAYSGRLALFLSANQYFDGATSSKAIATGSGYTYWRLTTSTVADTTVVAQLGVNTTSQTADAATSGTDVFPIQVSANGAINMPLIHNVGSGSITSGTYTPTLTDIANTSARTSNGAQYMRVGNVVTVSGTMDVTTTAQAGTATSLNISLPIASNFANGNQCSGTVSVSAAGGTAYTSGFITSDATNDAARVSFNSISAGSRTLQFHFTYQVI